MARTQVIKNYKNLVKGFVTEGNEFDEVDGAIRDGLNVEILRTGGVRRRRGLQKEDTATVDKTLASTHAGYSGNVFTWKNVGGDSQTHFVVIQYGTSLYFYKKGQSSVLLDHYVGTVALTANTHGATASAPYTDVAFSSINGALYVVGDLIKPALIVYDSGSFYKEDFLVRFRDFIGDPDDAFLNGDGISDSYYPINKSVNTVVGTFTDDETITGGTSGVTMKFIRLRSSIGGGYDGLYVYSLSGTLTDGETLTGGSSGATCVYHLAGAAFETAYQTDAILYPNAHGNNLFNQGWSITNMVSYARNSTSYKWPSNAQVMAAGKDSSDNFSATELDKITFGTTPAPRGHYIVSMDQPEAKTFDSGYGSAYANHYPSCIGAFASRLFIGGMNYKHFANWIFFSPILGQSPEDQVASLGGIQDVQAAQCFQINDPTAEYNSSLLATDGGVIIVPDMGTPVAYLSLEKALLIIADNGVWAITGATSDTGFTADVYSVDRISDIGCKSPRSIVVADKEVFFWSDTGIYSVAPGDIPGKYTTNNITLDTIHTFYKTISASSKRAASGYYDKFSQQIRWTYQSATLTYANHHDAELILDLKLKCFHPPRVLAQADGSSKNQDPYIIGYVQDELEPNLSGFPTLKTVNIRADTGTNSYLFFGQFDDDTFIDWANYNSGAAYSSYVEFWADHVGDPVRDKKPVYVFCYFKKTEDGFVDNGSGGLIAKHQSSCLATAKYSWHITDVAGKWSAQKQVYRYNRPYVPVDVNDTYDTGESIIVTKTRFKGKGKALTLKFESETGKDFNLIGYAIPYTAVYTP